MSIISRYEVRLKCIELATTMSSSQDPLDTIFVKADKIYEWINNVGDGNKKPHRGKKQRYYSKAGENKPIVTMNRAKQNFLRKALSGTDNPIACLRFFTDKQFSRNPQPTKVYAIVNPKFVEQ